ncbi:MAG: DNA-binding response regulator [Proteobacteria bacterium]|nr:DNA-binding response regulator [Pseudomonadota bacterium]
MKIAFLDDHPQLAEAIAGAVAAALPGTQVDCYSHWSELEPTLVPEQYDLLFLDMRLEDCLGAELIVPIQELSPKTRIVLLSAFAQNDLLLKCLNLGIVGYISKTSPIETLLKAVNAVAAGGTFFDENINLDAESKQAEPDTRKSS